MYYALITIFCLIVNEDWNQVLYTYAKGHESPITSYVFISFVVLIGNFFFLQTFLALLIGNF